MVLNMKNDNKQLLSKKATDWFRAIGVIMVVVSHYAEWWTWFTPTEGNAELFRTALSKLGVYGVDIFLLFSGYAMVKSLGRERMYPEFVWKRVKNVYIPYFIVIGTIELLAGGFTSAQDFGLFASGYDYWYMFVLFVFYIGFIVIWTVMGSREVRVITFAVFTFAFSYILYDKGMQDFWYVSNITFALGVIIGEYEKPVKKCVDKGGLLIAPVLAVAMVFVVRAGLGLSASAAEYTPQQMIGQEIGATVIWTVLVLIVAAKWKFCDRIMITLGRNSLYIYLTHTYIFMRCVNTFAFRVPFRFLSAAAITAVVSILCGLLFTGVYRLADGKAGSRR